jgi:hypothetical protein
MRFLRKAELAVLASIDRSGTSERNVFVRMPQPSSASVAYSHLALYFNDGYLVDQLHSIATMLSELILYREESEKSYDG